MTDAERAVTAAYLEHFTDADLDLLRGIERRAAAAQDRRAVPAAGPGALESMLGSPAVVDAIFGEPTAGAPLLGASPFLVFAVALHGAGTALQSAPYVAEWLGPGRRMPVFDVAQLQDFMASPWRRFFLTELLASYTHVASGSVLVPTRRGFRRQRFSELDPVRLAGLLDVVTDAERPGVLRRLGDLALFLTGVFPDHLARRGFGPVEEGRLLRAGVASPTRPDSPGDQPDAAVFDRGAVGLLEQLGRRWYGGAFDLLTRPVADNVAVLGELPQRFPQARRVLGLVTERFLFSDRDRWFGAAFG
jgi:hypothetical protein